MRGLAIRLVMAGAVVTWAPAAGGAEIGWSNVTVRVYDGAGVTRPVEDAALALAARTLAPAAVEVTWVRCGRRDAPAEGRCSTPTRPGELVLRLVRSAGVDEGRGAVSLGHALLESGTGAGVLATVFVDRVSSLAEASSADVATVLGRAVAHELGHLLIGRSTHSDQGLMRPLWTQAQVRRNSLTDWAFAAVDLSAIRAGSERRRWRADAGSQERAASAASTRAGVNGI